MPRQIVTSSDRSRLNEDKRDGIWGKVWQQGIASSTAVIVAGPKRVKGSMELDWWYKRKSLKRLVITTSQSSTSAQASKTLFRFVVANAPTETTADGER